MDAFNIKPFTDNGIALTRSLLTSPWLTHKTEHVAICRVAIRLPRLRDEESHVCTCSV